MFLMGTVVVLSLANLVYLVFVDVFQPPFILITFEEVDQILASSLWVLIAFELFHSMRIYLEEETAHSSHHGETVLLVGIIAIARKVIILNLHDYDGVAIIGLAAIIAALCAGYFLLRRSNR